MENHKFIFLSWHFKFQNQTKRYSAWQQGFVLPITTADAAIILQRNVCLVKAACYLKSQDGSASKDPTFNYGILKTHDFWNHFQAVSKHFTTETKSSAACDHKCPVFGTRCFTIIVINNNNEFPTDPSHKRFTFQELISPRSSSVRHCFRKYHYHARKKNSKDLFLRVIESSNPSQNYYN